MVDEWDRRKYTTGSGRRSYSDDYVVYVHDGYSHPYYKTIKLTRRWWQLTSPAEKIRKAKIKAERIAKELNHREMYKFHEAEIADG